MPTKYECPKCHRNDQLKMIRTKKIVYDMDKYGYRHVAQQGDVVFDKTTELGCGCGYEGRPEEFMKEDELNVKCTHGN